MINIGFKFISHLYIHCILDAKNPSGTKMRQLKNQNREQLKNKIAKALNGDIKMLPAELQDILLDDLVTAFESRLKVLSQVHLNLRCFIDVGVEVSNETLQT